jgi:hypothetical protein
MKNYRKILLLLLFLPALLGMAGYSKGYDNDDNDPIDLEGMTVQEIQALFTGKWQEIDRGSNLFPELPTDGHIIEFLADGIFLTSLSDVRRHYSLDSKFLYLDGGKAPDGHTYRHTFIGSRYKLRLDYVDGAIEESGGTPLFQIYKRIK